MGQVPAGARGYEGFPGKIGRTAAESQRAWKRERRAPEGAPNILIVLLDDMGFSDIGPYGSEIPTPTLDRLASNGVRLNNYHTAPVCSPSRAAMLTGLNPHRAGFASVAGFDPGFPNMRLEIDEDVITLPEALRANGYATFAVGKWHLTRDALMHDAAPKDTWPLQRGFDRYFGSLEGCNSFFHPNRLVRDNAALDIAEFPDDFYLTDALTDEAISMIRGLRANDSRKPFFMYFAHVAMHGPLGAKPADLAAMRGRYSQGWDVMRQARYERQIASGLFPEGTQLAPRNRDKGYEVDAWDELDADQKELYARHMEVYAAMVANVDENLGRIVATLEELGELDNTIIIFTSDNGGTAEAGPHGTRSYFSHFLQLSGIPTDWERDVPRDLDLIGSPQAMVHYPRGWGMVSNTPFRLYKAHTFAGGIRVPFVMSWPQGIQPGDDNVRSQFQYVTDVFPTLMQLAGLETPATRHGQPIKEQDGVSFSQILNDKDAAGSRREQYSEFGGRRGFYRDGWKIIAHHAPMESFEESKWELYHVEVDPTELNNVAEEFPDKLAEMAEAWEEAAWANTVFPMGAHIAPGRRPDEAELSKPVTIYPGTPKLERYRSTRLTTLRSFDVAIQLTHGQEDQGVLIAHGDQGGGYMVYVEDGHVRLAYNQYGHLREADGGVLTPGAHLIELQVRWLPAFHVSVALLVDGHEVAKLEKVAMLVGLAPFSGIDVGLNRGGPVHWRVYERHRSFPYSGQLDHATWTPGEPAEYDPAEIARAEIEAAMFYD